MTPQSTLNPLEIAEANRQEASESLPEDSRHQLGQFFTPTPLAQLIASRVCLDGIRPQEGPLRILDPGAGVGILGAALVHRIAEELPGVPIEITWVEVDADVLSTLEGTRRAMLLWASEHGVDLDLRIVGDDFVEWASRRVTSRHSTGQLFDGVPPDLFDIVIMNPPYAKIRTRSRHRSLTAQAACEVTNLYAAFVSLGLECLRDGGRLVAITPRSFTNGPYFRPFRHFLKARAFFESVDLFESRSDLFADSDVLQENVVYSLQRTDARPPSVRLYFHNRNGSVEVRETDHDWLMPPDDQELFIFLRNGDDAHETARQVNGLPCYITDLGVEVSTGRVVAFRSKDNLRADPCDGSAPLLYPHHLRGGSITWPLKSGKPNAININDATRSMLFPAGDYVAVKRFTTKEERRRVVATWVPASQLSPEHVAFENHLNILHSDGAALERDIAVGLSLYLQSTKVDRYFRQFSGHTQVNATDLRCIRYPDKETLRALGKVVSDPSSLDQSQVDELVESVLWNHEVNV